MKQQITPQLLQKYIDQSCTEEETALVENWYQNLNLQEGRKIQTWNRESVFHRIQDEINAGNRKSKFRQWKTISIAAAVVFLIGINFFLFQNKSTDTDQSTVLKTSDPFADITRFTNSTSGIEKKMLPDGSTVWLNPGSSIEYFKKHRDSAREVNFTGEAFFDVAKDKEHPFLIYTGELRTKVVGTSFNIQAFSNSRTIKVSVVTGKVEVSHHSAKKKTQAVLLEPNEQASFVVATKALTRQSLSVENVRKEYWQPVTLSFSDASVKEVVSALETAFEIKIKLVNPGLSACRLRVDFNNQKLPQIMDMLEKLLDVECELKGKELLISGQGCTN